MRNINDFINESRHNASDFEKIQYVLFTEDLLGNKIDGIPYIDLNELIDNEFDNENVEYMKYDSLDEVINDIKKLKPGEKLILEYHHTDEGILKWYTEMIARLK